jgi:hypothetical protein
MNKNKIKLQPITNKEHLQQIPYNPELKTPILIEYQKTPNHKKKKGMHQNFIPTHTCSPCNMKTIFHFIGVNKLHVQLLLLLSIAFNS